MIIYMYLTIIVVFSILTGIITTIIEKKGLQVQAEQPKVTAKKSVIKKVQVPKKVVRTNKKQIPNIPKIPVVQANTNLSHTIEVLNIEKNVPSCDEPRILSIIDEEVL